jgi:uncharacterized protein YbjT (DUF2867 family)
MEKVLIVGANGNTGRHIAGIMKDHGNYDPVAMIRKKEQASYFEDKGISTVVADLEGDLSHAVEGMDKIIFAAGSGGGTGKEKTKSVDQDGAIKLVDEAKSHNVKKFVMLSSMGADNPESVPDLQFYLKAKQAADQHLKDSGLNYTIIRPGKLTTEEGSGEIELGESLNHFGEISRKDVAQVLVSSLDHANVKNRTLELLRGKKHIEEALSDLN